MKTGRHGKRGSGLLAVFAVGAITLSMLGGAAALVVLQLSVSPVLTGSMRPTFDPGAALPTRSISREAVRPGAVIVFRPPGHTDSYAHRVVEVSRGAAVPVITTRGDANPANDDWRAELVEPTARQVVFAVPQLGAADGRPAPAQHPSAGPCPGWSRLHRHRRPRRARK